MPTKPAAIYHPSDQRIAQDEEKQKRREANGAKKSAKPKPAEKPDAV